jgi:hypothetical protein
MGFKIRANVHVGIRDLESFLLLQHGDEKVIWSCGKGFRTYLFDDRTGAYPVVDYAVAADSIDAF